MSFMEEYQNWCAKSAEMPEDLAQELRAIADNAEAIESQFCEVLKFGTAGMRGLMGAGINRMNVYTVRRAAKGLAAWLNTTDLPKSCAIAYDSRHKSQLFAEICATALAGEGVQVYLYHELAPTPMLSFAVRDLGCGCGIVISASHNAGTYNGMKCYGPDGCQMTDEPAAIVYDAILKTPIFSAADKALSDYLSEGIVQYIGMDLWERYYQTVLGQSLCGKLIPMAGLKVLYTPLNGTGNKPVRTILGRLGAQVEIVKCQELPDGDFTTCPYPNPETDAALAEAVKLAETVKPDLVIGTDPDADRVTVAVPGKDGFVKLSGNELGCLLLNYILNNRVRRGDLPKNAEFVRSIVSTPMADRIGAAYGCRTKATLTGFKYIGGEILRLEQEKHDDEFVFGFEESCGYLKGTYARDKDAMVATMLACEMAACAKMDGLTLLDLMEHLYKTYGYFVSKVQSVELVGLDGPKKCVEFMKGIRADVPKTLAGLPVVSTYDYQSSVKTCLVRGVTEEIDLPSSNVFEMDLEGGTKVILRPSGTEPKLKIYYLAVGATAAEAERIIEESKAYLTKLLP